MCAYLYTQAPHACGGATLKDGANLPLATLCHWISQSCHNALHLWRRRDCGSSPLQSPWSSQSPAGAWHTESISTWSRCRGGIPEQEAQFPGQMGSLQGIKPRVEGSTPLSPVPSRLVSAQGLRPCGCNTLRSHQAEPRAHLQMRLILRLLVSRTHISDQICSQVSSAARPEAEALALGSWISSGPDDEWGCSGRGLDPHPIPVGPARGPSSQWVRLGGRSLPGTVCTSLGP